MNEGSSDTDLKGSVRTGDCLWSETEGEEKRENLIA